MNRNEPLELGLIQDRRLHPKRFLKNLQYRIFRSQYSYLALCFFAPIVLMYGIYIVQGLYPFGDTSPLVLDMNAQYVSFFEATRDSILGERSALYSFSRSLGGEFGGMIAYYTASPLSIITILFPKDRIQEAILTILLIKCGLSGATFGFYLHKKSRNPKKLVIFAFSMLYALTAYAVVHQHNTMWIDAVIWLPLLALGIENLVYRKKYILYVVSLSVIMIANYYIGFMVCIFSLLYFCFCYFSKPKDVLNPYNERFHFTRAGTRFVLFSILSAMISAFMLVMAYYSLGFGKTEFSTPNWSLQANFDIMDFLAKFLPGSYDTVEPAGLPFVYCGVITLFLVPLYFASKKINLREKVAALALISVFVFSFIVNPLDLIWHGFSAPNWLNGRYSFLFCFILLVLAYKAFGNLKEFSEKAILAIAGVLVLFTVIVQKYEFDSFITTENKLLTFECIWFSVAFIAVIAAILCIYVRLKKRKNSNARKSSHITAVSGVLIAVVCLELFCNGAVCTNLLNKDVTYAKYSKVSTHLATYRSVVNEIKQQDSSFYRMEKTYIRTKNDNMALQMYGLTSSTSTLNAKAIAFVGDLGYVGRSHLTMYKGGTAVGDSLLGLKYVIDDSTRTTFDHVYTPVESLGTDKLTVYKNPNALSLVYGVDSDINELDLSNHTNVFEKYNAMLTAMLGRDEFVDLFKFVPSNDITIGGSCSRNNIVGNGANFKTPADKTGSVVFNYVAPEDGYYYFYTHGSSNKDLTVSITNYPTKRNYMRGDYNHIVIGGYFAKGEDIKVTITVPENCTYKVNSLSDNLAYMSLDEYNAIFSELKSNPQLNISSDYTEDHIEGTLTTQKANQTILTTIPYDEGWNVYVNDEKIETYETLDALMAFDIPQAGTYKITLEYMPSVYVLSYAVTAFGIFIFIVLIVLGILLKKVFKVKMRTYAPDYFDLADFDVEELEEVDEADSLPQSTSDEASEHQSEDAKESTEENANENAKESTEYLFDEPLDNDNNEP